MEVGLAVTVDPLADDNPADGLHVNEFAPLASSDVDLPIQIAGLVGVTFITKADRTVTVTLAVLEQFAALVPVIV